MDTSSDISTTSVPSNEPCPSNNVSFSGNQENSTHHTCFDKSPSTDDTYPVDDPSMSSTKQYSSREQLSILNSDEEENPVLATDAPVPPPQDNIEQQYNLEEASEHSSPALARDTGSLSSQAFILGPNLPNSISDESVSLSEDTSSEESSTVIPNSEGLAFRIIPSFYAAAETGNGNILFEILHRLTQETTSSPTDIINTPSTFTGLTVLHYAASRGHLVLIEYLLDAGAEVDFEDREGETALLKAAFGGHLDVVKCLVNSHASIDHKDKDGWTALHNACSYGHLEIVKWLLENTSVDVNTRSKMNHTPLMNAASRGFLDIVIYLLSEANADALIQNDFGEKAYDVAAARIEAQICELLDETERSAQANYDTVDCHLNVLVILHENQRAPQSLLSRLATPRFSIGTLSEIGVHPWTLLDGSPGSKDTTQLPHSSNESSMEEEWFWLTDWQIDLRHSQVDPEEGWQYAYSFDASEDEWYRSPPGASLNSNWVRRRRWIRVMKRRLACNMHESISDNEDNSFVPTPLQLGEPSSSANRPNTIAIQINNHSDNRTSDNHTFHLNESHISRSLQNSDINSSYYTDTDHSPVTNRSIVRSNTVSVMGGGHLRQTSNASSANTNSTSGITSSLLQVINTTSTRLVPLSPSLWESDGDAPDCRQCGRRFMLFLRRHHCRRCGLVFCDRCTSSRFPFPTPAYVGDTSSVTYQRVCDTCVALLNSLPKRSNSLVTPSIMSRTNSQTSVMNECPVCFTLLQSISIDRGGQERHVKECLETRGFSSSPRGSRYLNFKLNEDSNLLGQECPICFEEFELGETLARLTCLCIYHQECIDSWFGRGKQCPFHSG
ncbi:hypothetical protein K7432_001592 [Basidiobolus ranarum]|uniref:Uncharacterized protein n=1 Tax=Basidiobolus ranarum TaxID=34480 RepID=A0ABR2W9E2_9FUNG